MQKFIVLFLISITTLSAQPYYTPLRAAFGVEAFGTAPKGQVYAEAAFGYRARSFWDVQTGIGMVNSGKFGSYTLSMALSYSYLLNPYRRKPCRPNPGYNGFELYVEGGVATFFVDTYDDVALPTKYGEDLFTPLGLAGLRFHVVSERWIYILKVRYTPALIESRFASVAGVAIGLGWR